MRQANPRQKVVSLIFTAHDRDEGIAHIQQVLKEKEVYGGFFLTGEYIENNVKKVRSLYRQGHYIGPHSHAHLLYADWGTRESLVTRDSFETDMKANLLVLKQVTEKQTPSIFVPPYEWYNEEIVNWARQLGMTVINFTPELRTAADYTYPEMGSRYLSSEKILEGLWEKESLDGLNGFIILLHVGADERRKDKLYSYLGVIIDELRGRGYGFRRIDELIYAAGNLD